MAFIYCTKNLINGKIYIGKSKNKDDSYFGSGLRIVKAVKKYGKENFSKIYLEECDLLDVNNREIFWIEYFQSTNLDIGYNISKGGTGGDHYWTTLTLDQRKQHKEKISKSRKGVKRNLSEETRKKLSENCAKMTRDPENIKKRIEASIRHWTCIDHSSKEIFYTNSLKDFCKERNLIYGNFLYNARTRKNYVANHWSCRSGILNYDTVENIILKIEDEIKIAESKIKEKIRSYDKSKERNPMYGKRHSESTKEKIRQTLRQRKINESNNNCS